MSRLYLSKPPLGEQISPSCGGYSTTNAAFQDVTNLSRTITTYGRPVVVKLEHDGVLAANLGMVYADNGGVSSADADAFVNFVRGSTDISTQRIATTASAAGTGLATRIPASAYSHTDVVPPGTYTYKVQIKSSGGGKAAGMNYTRLVVYEMP